MKIFFFLTIIGIKTFDVESVTDLSGLYDFQSCSCTVLRCLESSFYQINQTQYGDFIIKYKSSILAAYGKTFSINNGAQTQVTMQWLPGMDFDTNCTGTWRPNKRTIDLNCGDKLRYCTGLFTCRYNSGPCYRNNSNTIYIQSITICWKIIIYLFIIFIITSY